MAAKKKTAATKKKTPVAKKSKSTSAKKTVQASAQAKSKVKPKVKAKKASKKKVTKIEQTTKPITLNVTDKEKMALIEEAAYYIAESRGFTGGDPQQDWLAAEAKVDAMLQLGSKQNQ